MIWDRSLFMRDISIERLQRNLTSVMRRTAVPRAHDRVIQRAGIDIGRVEAIALSRIADAGSMRITELAAQLGVACSTAGRHAANLEDDALVTRALDDGDRRVTVVTPTSRGIEYVERLRQAHRQMLSEFLRDWDDDDVTALSDLMGRMADAIDFSTDPVPA